MSDPVLDQGVGPDWYMTTSGQGVDVSGPFRCIMKSDYKKAPNGICVTDNSMFDRDA